MEWKDFFKIVRVQLLDLSSLNTSSVTNVSKMLIGCNSLKALYIPGLDLSKVNNANNLFIDDGSGSMQLKYFYVIGSTFSESILNEIKSSLNEIIVCQDNNQVSSEGNKDFKYIEKCCNFNSEKGKCVTSNYITIHYPNNDTNGQGYQFSIPENYKNLIEFINKGDSILTKNYTNININQNDFQIEIHFSSNITTLEEFFSGMKDIISVDFNNFYSSDLTSVKKMFSGCSSLESVDFSNFNTEKITDICLKDVVN